MNTWIVFLAFGISLNIQAFSPSHLEKLKNKKDITYEDLAHENKGCPENSDCSQSNGNKLLNWNGLIKKYIKRPNILATKLEIFRKKNGLPVEFLFRDDHDIKQSLDPIVWDSQCRHHNPKEGKKILKGMKFFVNNPKSKLVRFITVKTDKDIYEIPYGDQPLFIYQKNLIIVKEYEGAFFNLAISPQGKWKILNIPTKLISKGRINRQNTECKEKKKPNDFFLSTYCTEIWDEDKKESISIEQDWACP